MASTHSECKFSLKRIICLVTAFVLIVTVSVCVSFASNVDPYEKFLDDLSTLETYAEVYHNSHKYSTSKELLVLKYIRTANSSYTSSVWTLIAGDAETDFENYVAEQDSINGTSAASLKKLGTLALPNGDTIDAVHMFATMNMIARGQGDLGGWAGDICDLLYYKMQYISSSDYTFDELTEMASGYLGTGGSGFDINDIRSDLDALNISKLYKSSYADCIRSYYSDLTNYQRVESFLTNRFPSTVQTRDELRKSAYSGYQSTYMSILEISRNISGNAFANQRKACCYAFADYLYDTVNSYSVTFDWGTDAPKVEALPGSDEAYSSIDHAVSFANSTFGSGYLCYAQRNGENGVWQFSGWNYTESKHVISFTGSWSFTKLPDPVISLSGGAILSGTYGDYAPGASVLSVQLDSSGETCSGSFSINYDSRLDVEVEKILPCEVSILDGETRVSWESPTLLSGTNEILRIVFKNAGEIVVDDSVILDVSFSNCITNYPNGKIITTAQYTQGKICRSSGLDVTVLENSYENQKICVKTQIQDGFYGTVESVGKVVPILAGYRNKKLIDACATANMTTSKDKSIAEFELAVNTEIDEIKLLLVSETSFVPIKTLVVDVPAE